MYSKTAKIFKKQEANQNLVQNVKMSPNPVKNQLNITLTTSHDEKVSYSVSNMLGQTVHETIVKDIKKGTHTESINTSNLAVGIYMLIVQTSSGYSQFKFVKQ
jgi:hypothetical protein